MTQATIDDVGAFTTQNRTNANANFTEIYGAVKNGTGNITSQNITAQNMTVTGVLTNSGSSTSTPIAATGATLSLTAALHAGRTVVQNAASGCAIALPAATGTGNVYRIIVKTTITSVGVVISCTPLTDVFIGMAWVMSDNSQAVLAYLPAATDNTFTLNGTTTGGYLGHLVDFRDIASGIWEVQSFGKATGTEATPFSHV